MQSLIYWRCCRSSLGLTLWQHVLKNAGNLLFHPRKCSKNKSLGTFSKHFANLFVVAWFGFFTQLFLVSFWWRKLSLVLDFCKTVNVCVKCTCTFFKIWDSSLILKYVSPTLTYYIIFVLTRIGPWTWTEPSANEKRRGLLTVSP